MIKMMVKHGIAVDDRDHWMIEFNNKKTIREVYGISQGINPIVYHNGSEEIVVVHEIKATTIDDAIKILDHIKLNEDSRRKAKAKGEPLFSG
jgi:hypothetical protein